MTTNVENFNLEEGFAIPENMELSETTETLDDVELSKTREIIETGGDTSEIKILSPELAVLLLEKNEGEDVVIDLKGLKNIDKKTARVLSKFKGKQIDLPFDIKLYDDVLCALLPIKSKLNIVEKLNAFISNELNNRLLVLQKEIEETGEDLDWKNDRGIIKYDATTNTVQSWGKSVEVENIMDNKFRLKGLGFDVSWDEGLWLANFKNWFKHEYGDKEHSRVTLGFEPNNWFNIFHYYIRKYQTKYFGFELGKTITNKGIIDKYLPDCSKDNEKLREIARWLYDGNDPTKYHKYEKKE